MGLLANLRKKPIVKMIMLGLVALVILAVLGGGGWYGYRKFQAIRAAKAQAALGQNPDGLPHGEGEDDAGEDAEEEGEGHGAGPAILIYKNNVNLEGRKNTYLVVELHILFRDAELGKRATSDKATAENSMIRALLLDLLSGKSVEEASDIETRETIRQEIKDKLNEKFAPKPLAPGEKVDKEKKRPKRPVKDVLVVAWAIAQ